jgi:hypothetical protein
MSAAAGGDFCPFLQSLASLRHLGLAPGIPDALEFVLITLCHG